jgi:4,5-dihydroxyphthalate decarboxylase
MGRVPLALACMTYDRTFSLKDGSVAPEGIDLNYLAIENPGAIFVRMLNNYEFDSCEMSLSSYLTARSENKPMIAIPVFTSRVFRHSYIFVNSDSGIREPRDLIGKKVGTPRYHMTAPIWIRGILQHEYDVPLEKIRWYTERPEKIASPNMKVDLKPIPEGSSLERLLESGELDAVTEAHLFPSYFNGRGRIRRLFPDYKTVEADYYRRNKVFPIMHVIVLKREVYDANPWVAVSLHSAFVESKRRFYALASDLVQGKLSNPWSLAALEELKELMGDDPYSYSLGQSEGTLRTLVDYMIEQGLLGPLPSLEELFAPNTIRLTG